MHGSLCVRLKDILVLLVNFLCDNRAQIEANSYSELVAKLSGVVMGLLRHCTVGLHVTTV